MTRWAEWRKGVRAWGRLRPLALLLLALGPLAAASAAAPLQGGAPRAPLLPTRLAATSPGSAAPGRLPALQALAPQEILAQGFRAPTGVTVAPDGRLFFTDEQEGSLFEIEAPTNGVPGNGTPLVPPRLRLLTTGLLEPRGVLWVRGEDREFLLLLAEGLKTSRSGRDKDRDDDERDRSGKRGGDRDDDSRDRSSPRGLLLRFDLASGTVTILAHGLTGPRGLTRAADGSVYLSTEGTPPAQGREGRNGDRDGDDRDTEHGDDDDNGSRGPFPGTILRWTPATGGSPASLTTVARGFARPDGLLLLPDGTLLVTAEGYRTGRLRLRGSVFRLHLPTSPPPVTVHLAERLERPSGLALDGPGALFVSGERRGPGRGRFPGVVLKLPEGAPVSPFATGLDEPRGLTLDHEGHLYVADAEAGVLLRFRAPPPPQLDDPGPVMTNENPYPVRGTAQGGTTIVVLGGQERVTVLTGENRAFTASVPLQANQETPLQVFAVGGAGQGLASRPVLLAVTHDGLPPETTITDGPTGEVAVSEATFTFTGQDNLTPLERLQFAWARDAGPFTAFGPATSATLTLTTLPEGEHTFRVKARDLAGNEDPTPAERRFTVRRQQDPVLTRFEPTSGKVGDQVRLIGTNFRAELTGNSVTFTGPNATRVAAIVTGATPTELTVTVPAGAITGSLQVTTPSGTATSTGHFVVLPSPDFTLTAVPAAGTALQGSQANYALNVSGVEGFTGLVTLSITGLPTGVSATFTPPTLAPGQRGTLTLTVGGSVATGSAPLTVTGTATISGASRSHSVRLTLGVQAGGRTALAGQVLVVDSTPFPGVRLTLGGQTTLTDAAGAFLLADVPAGTHPLSVDANAARPGFPIYGVDVTLVAGQLTALPPFRITPPPPPERFTPISNASQDQVITDPRYPGVAITLPAGVTVVGWDGVVKTRLAIERLTPDQLAMPPPPFPTRSLYQFSFGTPMGGLPDVPLPVTIPNDLELDPGEQVEIWYYDAAPLPGMPATWRLAGLGTVSEDGRRVVSNPGVGIARFCGVCGTTCIRDRTDKQEKVDPDGQKVAEPVDAATGLFTLDKTDLILPGRLPVSLTRAFNPLDPFGKIAGFELGLGPGWALSVDVVLLELGPALRRLILPGNARFEFARQPDGTFANASHSRFAGAVLTHSGSTHTLRFKAGATWTFATGFLARGRQIPIAGLWLLTQQADRMGNTLTISRDRFGGVTQLTEPAGRALTFSLDASSGRITEVADPLGRTVRYGYDSALRLSTVTDPAEGRTTYTYDSAGRITTITDPRNILFLTNTYSPASGRILRQTQADGGVWIFRYALQGATVTGPGCPGPSCPTEESGDTIAQGFTFSAGTITATIVTDPRGHVTTTRFGPDRLPRETVDALGQTTRFERDAGGRLLSTTDPLGRVTRFAYDAQGNVTSITDPQGHTRTFTYDLTVNKVTSITDPLGNLTTFEYDAQGNLVAIADPEQNTNPVPDQRLKTRITYNEFGQPLTTTDSLGNTTTFTYDAVGNLTQITDPLGHTTTRTYDAASRLLTQTDPRGKQTQFGYDPMNRLTQITDTLNGHTRFTYDGNGNLLTVTDARGSITSHTYDSMDRLATRTDPLTRTETFTFDPLGNLVGTTDRKNQTTTFIYDALNRRTQATYPDGSITTLTYDAAGRRTLADDTADPHRPIGMTYDTLDRLLAETTTLGTVIYEYDLLGRRIQMTVAGQAPVAYAYDRNSRLRTIQQEPLAPVDLQYDAAGRRTFLTLPNGVSTEYQYDLASRLTALIYRNTLGPLGDLTYTYDAAGNRTSVRGSFARTLLPDPISSATYDAANQQLQFGANTMTFDANGSLATLTDPTGTTTFTWDARDRLVGLAAPRALASFGYDGLGRRATKATNGLATEYLYADLDVVQELAGGTPVSVSRGPRLDEPLVRNTSEYYLADHLGSTIALTDSTGTLATRYTYDPFGRTATDGPISSNPFQYTAREQDGSTGLFFYRSRFYAPHLQRFLAEDRIGFLGGINLYRYVRNNPVSYLDPLGFDVTIYYYPPDASNLAVQHNAIQVNSGPIYGFYPHPDFRSRSAVKVVPGDIRHDLPSGTSITIPTTSLQDETIEGIISNMHGLQSRGQRAPYQAFGFGGKNCATFITSLLQAAGLQVPTTRIPELLIPRLRPGSGPDVITVP